MNSIIDAQLIALSNVIREIREDRIATIEELPIFRVLNAEWQQQARLDPAKVLNHIYSGIQPFLESDFNIEDNADELLTLKYQQDGIESFRQNPPMFEPIRECVALSGTNNLFSLTVMLIFKRFYAEFRISDFIPCFIDYSNTSLRHGAHETITTYNEENYEFVTNPERHKIIGKLADPLVSQMLASQLNYIFHRKYLPIFTTILGEGHATTLLMIPVIINEQQDLQWHVININSDPSVLIFRYQIPLEAIKKYNTFVTTYQTLKKSTYHISNCNDNIQGSNTMTCVQYSQFIALNFLSNVGFFGVMTAEDIKTLCRNMTLQTDETKQRLNTTIIDLKDVFHQLIIETFDPTGTVVEYGERLMTERNSPHLQLEKVIFRMMSDIIAISDTDRVLSSSDPSTNVWNFLREKRKELWKPTDLLLKRAVIVKRAPTIHNQRIMTSLLNEIQEGVGWSRENLRKYLFLIYYLENKQKKAEQFNLHRENIKLHRRIKKLTSEVSPLSNDELIQRDREIQDKMLELDTNLANLEAPIVSIDTQVDHMMSFVE